MNAALWSLSTAALLTSASAIAATPSEGVMDRGPVSPTAGAEVLEVQWLETSAPLEIEYGIALDFALPFEVRAVGTPDARLSLNLQEVRDLPGFFQDSMDVISLEPEDGTYLVGIGPNEYRPGLNIYTFNLLLCDQERCVSDALTLRLQVAWPGEGGGEDPVPEPIPLTQLPPR